MLDSVPEIPIQKYLPEILDGLFIILSDPRLEIRKACEAVLGEFLHGIVNVPQGVDYSVMINILIAHSQAPGMLISSELALLLMNHYFICRRAGAVYGNIVG